MIQHKITDRKIRLLLQEFLDRFGNLYLIGRNGMHRYDHADHSMMTAMEQDFHEEKEKETS